jgi:hypothetical protein
MVFLLAFCDSNLAYCRAATLWHHDHAVGITSANVYAGLLGMNLVEACSAAEDPFAVGFRRLLLSISGLHCGIVLSDVTSSLGYVCARLSTTCRTGRVQLCQCAFAAAEVLSTSDR